MAGSLNKVCLIGHLGADPEVKNIGQSGDKKVVNFSVATSETWRDKTSGEKREKTEWHRVVIWSEGLVKVASTYLKKGSLVYIEGQLQTRKWNKDGVDHYATEVVLQGFNAVLTMLGGKQDGGSSGPSEPKTTQAPQTAFDTGEDDIPFD